MFRVVFSVLAVAFAAVAQPAGSEIGMWQPPAGEKRIGGKVSCASLRSLTGFEFTIVSAVQGPVAGGGRDYCRITGLVQPAIRFEVALPSDWHGRLLMLGNGGYAGEDLEAPARLTTRDQAVRAGFAFTQTNTGHDAATEPLGAFATDPQKLADYCFRAVHVTVLAAKKIAQAYYGIAPKRSYWMGCSTGGRQGLMSAQRFPEDFDGVFAGAPVLDFVSTMSNYVSLQRALAKGPLTIEKLRLAGTHIYAQCDAKDGVKDGLIEDPRRCGVQPETQLPKCTSGQAGGCFSEGEITSLRTLYSDQSIDGRRVFPSWPVGIEVADLLGNVGWRNWLVRENGPPIQEVFGEAFFRYLALPKKDPNLRLADVDLVKINPQLGPIRAMLNATDTDLSAFRDRGGKLLMWFGWADPALNPNMGVEYYEAVSKQMGPKTPEFFRLFMMPGVFHCSGGPGCDTAPRLAALIDWVENGKAPERITASKLVDGRVVRTRPLCPYPQIAKYRGTGDTDDHANFTCSTPE